MSRERGEGRPAQRFSGQELNSRQLHGQSTVSVFRETTQPLGHNYLLFYTSLKHIHIWVVYRLQLAKEFVSIKKNKLFFSKGDFTVFSDKDPVIRNNIQAKMTQKF